MVEYFDTNKFNQLKDIKEKSNQNKDLVKICDDIINKMNHGHVYQKEWDDLNKKFPELFI